MVFNMPKEVTESTDIYKESTEMLMKPPQSHTLLLLGSDMRTTI